MRNLWIVGSAVLVLGLTGCSDSDDTATPTTTTTPAATTVRAAPVTPTLAPPAVPVTTAPPTRNAPAGLVSEATWTGDWPFTVTEGTLMCGAPDRVSFTANRNMYALNGAAKSAGGLDDVTAIWKDSAYAGVKVNLGPMIEKGLTLC
ncbi:DUF2511 domain-containing protein [Rhodococcus sp. PAMC28707]|uniref:DUF2511 domain-containing protein n=1 Tax=unclassified Rhodococcus (in: high G+C Gram-positive bacteria) TaxID=192944 RepID=UPI00109DF671|nr:MULTISPECIES: DUF2511 domain-containing protein [unclassified Rhodococcus (in: high G+C Gram-positive bacteria)]QCB50536.1 DUF2511 domain-containing protein [Rhodococcus sp. PAMC28705]QCB57772.1 DUF2511 domain-containing protein [Rhodococcus sp. PAMC28707]